MSIADEDSEMRNVSNEIIHRKSQRINGLISMTEIANGTQRHETITDASIYVGLSQFVLNNDKINFHVYHFPYN